MFFFFKSKAKKISAYLDEGDEALSAGDLTRAYKAGQRAAKLGAVEGYALMAHALGAQGHGDEVLTVLESRPGLERLAVSPHKFEAKY